MNRKERALRDEQMKAYKAEGHTMKEVAEHFGVSKSTAEKACTGIAPQRRIQNQYTGGNFDRIENCKRIIEKANPDWEYYGGFIDVDSQVEIRCKKCGYVFSRSMITLRHQQNRIDCPACLEAQSRKRKERDRLARLEKAKKERQSKRMEKMMAKAQVQTSLKFCPICNTAFIGKSTYCSKRCKDQNKWMMKEGYRYKFPLEEIFKRDKGICYLCGGVCDWNDKTVVNGVIVYGNNYPSRDHVIPKSKGGMNTWENIRLAHRICNSLKRDSPLVKKS